MAAPGAGGPCPAPLLGTRESPCPLPAGHLPFLGRGGSEAALSEEASGGLAQSRYCLVEQQC